MRTITHPGSPSRPRWRSAAGAGSRRQLALRGGLPVNEAVARALAEAGFDGGFLKLDGARLSRLRYVIPAASDGAHAAWYSETFAPAGPARLAEARAVAGWRDGERFIHCHGVWTLADGSRRMGHLLPHDSVLSHDVAVEALGVIGATFEAEEDAETAFKLFAPKATGHGSSAAARAIVCTVRPNEDICLAVEALCRGHEIAEAAVHGIGSLIGATFQGGHEVDSYATEVLVREGSVRQTPEGHRCRLDIALVGMDGSIAEGVVVRGQNPVCVTFELLIEERANGG